MKSLLLSIYFISSLAFAQEGHQNMPQSQDAKPYTCFFDGIKNPDGTISNMKIRTIQAGSVEEAHKKLLMMISLMQVSPEAKNPKNSFCHLKK